MRYEQLITLIYANLESKNERGIITMKKIQSRIITIGLFIALGCLYPVYAQEMLGQLDPQIGNPQGGFYDQINRVALGIGLMAGYRLKNTPVLFGLDIGIIIYGSEKKDAPFSSTIPGFRVEVVTDYDLVHANLLFRLIQPNSDAFLRPYVDALFGINFLSTTTAIRERFLFGSGEEILSDTNVDDTVLNYGIGGVLFRIYRPGNKEQRKDQLS